MLKTMRRVSYSKLIARYTVHLIYIFIHYHTIISMTESQYIITKRNYCCSLKCILTLLYPINLVSNLTACKNLIWDVSRILKKGSNVPFVMKNMDSLLKIWGHNVFVLLFTPLLNSVKTVHISMTLYIYNCKALV